MNSSQLSEMARIVREVCCTHGTYESHSPNLHLFVEERPGVPPPAVLNPSICLTIQGAKQVFLGDRQFGYAAAEYLLVSIDLPLMGRITEASSAKPFVGLKVDIDPKRLSALLMRMDSAPTPMRSSEKGLIVGQADRSLGDALLRLVGLLERPTDIPILHELILDEIYYRVLSSPYGHALAQMVLDGSRIQRIAEALKKLKSDFAQRISVDELASVSGMSVSSFH
ncbi:MAG: AraC family transcriptional regulator N-terminal domain-containing protein, partial [Pseudomonadota bacterium]